MVQSAPGGEGDDNLKRGVSDLGCGRGHDRQKRPNLVVAHATVLPLSASSGAPRPRAAIIAALSPALTTPTPCLSCARAGELRHELNRVGRLARKTGGGTPRAEGRSPLLVTLVTQKETTPRGSDVERSCRALKDLACVARAREYKVPFQEIERIADLEVGGLAGVVALRKGGNERFFHPEDGVGLEIGVPLDKEMCRDALVAGSRQR